MDARNQIDTGAGEDIELFLGAVSEGHTNGEAVADAPAEAAAEKQLPFRIPLSPEAVEFPYVVGVLTESQNGHKLTQFRHNGDGTLHRI